MGKHTKGAGPAKAGHGSNGVVRFDGERFINSQPPHDAQAAVVLNLQEHTSRTRRAARDAVQARNRRLLSPRLVRSWRVPSMAAFVQMNSFSILWSYMASNVFIFAGAEAGFSQAISPAAPSRTS
jgi:hypothetical protein